MNNDSNSNTISIDKTPLIFTIGTIISLCIASAGTNIIVVWSLGLLLFLFLYYTDIPMIHAKSPALLIIILLLFLNILAAIPIQHVVVKYLSPNAYNQNTIAEEAIKSVVSLGLADVNQNLFHLSRNEAGTLRIIILLLTGIAAYSISMTMNYPSKMLLLKILIIIGFIVGILGFAGQWIIPQGKTIWWFLPVNHGTPVACFINRNHFGGFLALICPIALLLCSETNSDSRKLIPIIWFTVYTVCAFFVLFSLSKGAWLACTASVLTVCLLLARKSPLLSILALIIPLTLTSLLLLYLPSDNSLKLKIVSIVGKANSTATLKDSVMNHPSFVSRYETWKDANNIISDYPLTGIGAGAFRMVFPQYRSASTRKSFAFAENEYVQIPAETGATGTACIVIFLLLIYGRLVRQLYSDVNSRLLIISALAVLSAVLIHSFFDFVIRLPLYFMFICIILGLAGNNKTSEPKLLARYQKLLLLSAFLTLLAIAPLLKKMHTYDDPDFIQSADIKSLCNALTWSPTSWQIWYHLGQKIYLTNDANSGLASHCMKQSVYYDPHNYTLLYNISIFMVKINDLESALKMYKNAKELRPWLPNIPELELMLKQ